MIIYHESSNKPLLKKSTGAVASLQAAYLAAVDIAPITDNAANVVRAIAQNIDLITGMMRLDEEHSFLDELYSLTDMPKGYLRQLLDEATDAGILECAIVAGKRAALPRIPDEAQP